MRSSACRWIGLGAMAAALGACGVSLGAPEAADRPAPSAASSFQWTLTLDGEARQMSGTSGELPTGDKQWSCGYLVEPVERNGEETVQVGALDCRHMPSGRVVDTMVMCLTHSKRTSDCGSTNLSFSLPGGTPHVVTLSCSSGESCSMPPLHVGAGGKKTPSFSLENDPSVTKSTSGAFAWQLGVADPGRSASNVPLAGAQTPLEVGVEGWSCSHRVLQATSSNYSSAEIGSLTCSVGGASFAVDAPCVTATPGAAYCNMSSLRFAEGSDNVRALSMACKTTGLNGCF